jgi:hypothetical protein
MVFFSGHAVVDASAYKEQVAQFQHEFNTNTTAASGGATNVAEGGAAGGGDTAGAGGMNDDDNDDLEASELPPAWSWYSNKKTRAESADDPGMGGRGPGRLYRKNTLESDAEEGEDGDGDNDEDGGYGAYYYGGN